MEQPHQTISEEKATQYKERLQFIVGRPLAVETIDVYAEDALKDLIELINELTINYKENNPDVVTGHFQESDIEDAAFKQYGLESIPTLLHTIQQKIIELKNIDNFIFHKVVTENRVITPPDEKAVSLIPGEQTYEAPAILPRLKTLLYILQTDFNIDFDSLELVSGKNSNIMMRKESYVTVKIQNLNRVVQVCDEEGNASYIFNTKEMEKQAISVRALDGMTKEEKNTLIENNPLLGRRFIQTLHWRSDLTEFLTVPFKIVEEDDNVQILSDEKQEDAPQVSINELDPWRGFWIDPETGEYWGTLSSLQQKFSKGQSLLTNHIKRIRPRSKIVKDTVGRATKAYSVKDIFNDDFLKKIMESPQVDKKGDWKGFYMSGQEHFGSLKTIKDRLGIDSGTLNKLAKKYNIASQPILDITGKIVDGYSYESFEQNSEVKEFREVPTAAVSGEWQNYYTDSQGGHWGTTFAMAKKLGVTTKVVTRWIRIAGATLTTKNIRATTTDSVKGDIYPAYKYEDILALPEVSESLEAPFMIEEGEWKGFYIDKEGNHWGTITAIQKKQKLNFYKLDEFMKNKKFKIKKIKKKNNVVSEAINIEDLLQDEDFKREFGK